VGLIPKFKTGDLVRCNYDYTDFYIFSQYYDESTHFHGIIAGYDPNRSWGFPYEFFYIVLCLDGKTRYFLEWEMELVYKKEQKDVDTEE